MKLPTGISHGGIIHIQLGPIPQLAVREHSDTISRILLDLQASVSIKDRVWEIVQAQQPAAVKIGRLLSLDVDHAMMGPIQELMLADGRVTPCPVYVH